MDLLTREVLRLWVKTADPAEVLDVVEFMVSELHDRPTRGTRQRSIRSRKVEQSKRRRPRATKPRAGA